MLAGIGLVALSIAGDAAGRPPAPTPLAREDLAFALSVVLLGLLMMITRRNAVSQVVGFMSLENGLILAATGAKGMPLVVEISVAFSVLIAFIVFGIFLFRIRERFDTVDVAARSTASAGSGDERRRSIRLAASILGAAGRGRRRCWRSCPATGWRRGSTCWRPALTLVCGARCCSAARRRAATILLVDDFNIVFIVLTTFVGFTTSAVQRQLHRPRARDRPADAALPALLSRACTR